MTLQEKLTSIMSNDTDIKAFLDDYTQEKSIKKGEVLSAAGSHQQNVYFVEQGLLRTFYYEQGKDITAGFYAEGSVFSTIINFAEREVSIYDIEALENTRVRYCNYTQLDERCKVSLTVANFTRYILQDIILEKNKRLAYFQYMTARDKYNALLAENPSILLRAPLGDIASFLGITQETLSRIRNQKQAND